MKPAEITLWKEALGCDDGLLGSVVTVSNFIGFYSDGNFDPGDCNLGTKFEFSTIAVGAYNYAEHDYMITGGVPDLMIGRKLIRIPNDERDNNASSDFIRFTNQVS